MSLTFDELSEVYRSELRESSLSKVTPGFHTEVADLVRELREEVARQRMLDPESVMLEGATSRKKSAERMVRDIVYIRANKVAKCAVRDAFSTTDPCLPSGIPETEIVMYAKVRGAVEETLQLASAGAEVRGC